MEYDWHAVINDGSAITARSVAGGILWDIGDHGNAD